MDRVTTAMITVTIVVNCMRKVRHVTVGVIVLTTNASTAVSCMTMMNPVTGGVETVKLSMTLPVYTSVKKKMMTIVTIVTRLGYARKRGVKTREII